MNGIKEMSDMKVVFEGKNATEAMHNCGCACHVPNTAPLGSETAAFQVKHVWAK